MRALSNLNVESSVVQECPCRRPAVRCGFDVFTVGSTKGFSSRTSTDVVSGVVSKRFRFDALCDQIPRWRRPPVQVLRPFDRFSRVNQRSFNGRRFFGHQFHGLWFNDARARHHQRRLPTHHSYRPRLDGEISNGIARRHRRCRNRRCNGRRLCRRG